VRFGFESNCSTLHPSRRARPKQGPGRLPVFCRCVSSFTCPDLLRQRRPMSDSMRPVSLEICSAPRISAPSPRSVHVECRVRRRRGRLRIFTRLRFHSTKGNAKRQTTKATDPFRVCLLPHPLGIAGDLKCRDVRHFGRSRSDSFDACGLAGKTVVPLIFVLCNLSLPGLGTCRAPGQSSPCV
jgi:hypothetical protein